MIGTDTISRSQTLDRDGFSIVRDVVAAVEIEEIAASFGTVSTIGAGTRRLLDFAWCRDLVDTIGRHPGISALLPIAYKAIQCTYFCKSADKNWLVAMHQDLAIPAKDRVSHSQLGNWSVKENQWFAQAPVALLDSLLTVRLHLDDSQEENGALRVIPGSHRMGRLDRQGAEQARARFGEIMCTADAGSTMLMRPLLLHASSKTTSPKPRRVLQYLFAPADPGFGLQWPD